jgi:hypothetical protein
VQAGLSLPRPEGLRACRRRPPSACRPRCSPFPDPHPVKTGSSQRPSVQRWQSGRGRRRPPEHVRPLSRLYLANQARWLLRSCGGCVLRGMRRRWLCSAQAPKM